MQFRESKSISMQIADRICDDIVLGTYTEEGRIPSVREYAALVEVNVNTVVRSYEYLQQQDLIYMKRGIGYFVKAGAKANVLAARRHSFITEELPRFFQQIQTLGLSADEIVRLYKTYEDTHPISTKENKS